MSWPNVCLGTVCRVIPGFAFKSTDFAKNGIPVVKIANIQDNYQVSMDDSDCLPEDLFTPKLSKFQLKDKAIVLAMTGATAGKIGRVRTEAPLLLNQRVAHIDVVGADPDFVWCVLSSQQYRERFFNIAGGAAQPNMSGGQIEAVEIPNPPLLIQNRIASILTSYEDLIENNRRRMALLEDAVRQLYREWFVRLRFPGYEHTGFVNGIPEGWKPTKLGNICRDLRDAVLPQDLEPDVPYIGLEHIPRRSITLADWGLTEDVTSLKLRFQAGDVLFGKIRPYFHKVGFTIVDGVTSSDALVLRPLSYDLYCLLLLTVSSDHFVTAVSQSVREGSKMPRADWNMMKAYPAPTPTKTLLSSFNSQVFPITEQLRILATQNRQLRQARDLLLPRLMRGEIVV